MYHPNNPSDKNANNSEEKKRAEDQDDSHQHGRTQATTPLTADSDTNWRNGSNSRHGTSRFFAKPRGHLFLRIQFCRRKNLARIVPDSDLNIFYQRQNNRKPYYPNDIKRQLRIFEAVYISIEHLDTIASSLFGLQFRETRNGRVAEITNAESLQKIADTQNIPHNIGSYQLTKIACWHQRDAQFKKEGNLQFIYVDPINPTDELVLNLLIKRSDQNHSNPESTRRMISGINMLCERALREQEIIPQQHQYNPFLPQQVDFRTDDTIYFPMPCVIIENLKNFVSFATGLHNQQLQELTKRGARDIAKFSSEFDSHIAKLKGTINFIKTSRETDARNIQHFDSSVIQRQVARITTLLTQEALRIAQLETAPSTSMPLSK